MSEYNHALKQQELLSDHPVFTDLFEIQHQLDGHLFDDIIEAQKYSQELLKPLEVRASEAGLLDKPVILSGLQIAMPRVVHDPTTGMESIEVYHVDAGGEFGAKNPPITGRLYGFHGAVVRSDLVKNDSEFYDNTDATSKEQYQILIHYCVGIKNNLTMSSVMGALCAQGNITATVLDFQSDKQISDSIAALDTLQSLSADTQTQGLTALIDELLTVDGDDSEQSRLYRLGEALRNHEIEFGVNEDYRAGVISLANARFGLYESQRFKIDAQSAFVKSQPPIFTENISAELSVVGLEFVPYYRVINERQTMLHEDIGSLSLKVEVRSDDPSITHGFIPFDKVVSFQAQKAV